VKREIKVITWEIGSGFLLIDYPIKIYTISFTLELTDTALFTFAPLNSSGSADPLTTASIGEDRVGFHHIQNKSNADGGEGTGRRTTINLHGIRFPKGVKIWTVGRNVNFQDDFIMIAQT
tara:strand:- start:173 stop:532 length:360 start_codon:yes stop_codon:yes gene_type:complete